VAPIPIELNRNTLYKEYSNATARRINNYFDIK